MFGRRLQYAVLLAGVGVFYIASGEWIAWILLLAVLGLPWLSLLLSIPAIWDFQASPAGVDILEQNEEAELWLLGSCSRPMPPFRGRIRVSNLRTGKSRRYQSEKDLPTDHCGSFRITLEKVRICDYLGLFAFPARRVEDKLVIVRPRPVPAEDLTNPQRLEIDRWVPMQGGGFSENHEHRLYRPGDNLNQMHWKLSAKVGDLILREPMQAVRGAVLLTMTLRGTPEELDRKFGRLLWVGNFLLQRELDFEIRVLTGDGLLSLPVSSEADLMKSIDTLLCTDCAAEGSVRDLAVNASWQYHIGGDDDEA